MKPNINSIEVHPKLSNNGHPVDGALVGAGSLWPSDPTLKYVCMDIVVMSLNIKYVYKIFFVTHFTAMTLMCCHKKNMAREKFLTR